MEPAYCPLCNDTRQRPSWFGATVFHGRSFPYVECLGCGSLYCDPMPDGAALASMYGLGYQEAFYSNAPSDDAGSTSQTDAQLLRWLDGMSRGTFLDYGCGAGRLLGVVQHHGWDAIGVEFDPAVAETTARQTGARVVSRKEDFGNAPVADVLHLGDVVEHLTQMNAQFPEIISMLRPGGLLISQGPLENNANLFLLLLRLQRSLRPTPPSTLPPYHVLLATARGQRSMFARFGLRELEFVLSEVAWPAPSRLTSADLRRPRQLALYGARLASQATSRLNRTHWGNRYFFAGRREPSVAREESVSARVSRQANTEP